MARYLTQSERFTKSISNLMFDIEVEMFTEEADEMREGSLLDPVFVLSLIEDFAKTWGLVGFTTCGIRATTSTVATHLYEYVSAHVNPGLTITVRTASSEATAGML